MKKSMIVSLDFRNNLLMLQLFQPRKEDAHED